MDQLINITDKLIIRNLENKNSRLSGEIETHLKTITALRTENMNLFAQSMRIREENEELKKLLKDKKIGITYG